MNSRSLAGLLTLGMLWGASFLLIRVAVPEFGAIALVAVRLALAAMILMPLVLARKELANVIRHWRPVVMMGVLHYAIPFTLFSYAMLTLSAGYTSIINASSPIFAGVVAKIWLGERLSVSRSSGLVLGLAGVAMLAWDKLALGSGSVAIAVGAAVVAAACYGFAAVLAKKHLVEVSPTGVAGGSMAAAALVMLPMSYVVWPDVAPSAEAWGMAALLGVVATAVAFVLYFRLIAAIGPSRAISVTFLIPLFGVVFGALFIGEQVTPTMILGGVVVAMGTALSTGMIELSGLIRRSGALAARVAVVSVVAAALNDTPPDVYADEGSTSTAVFVAANEFSYRTSEGWDSFETLALSAEVERTGKSLPWNAGLFAEYHLANDDRVAGTVLTGAFVGYRFGSVDLTGFWFSSQFPDQASRSTWMTRVRHQFMPGRKIGAEYLAYSDGLDRGELKLGYYGSVGDKGSMKLLFGSLVGEGWQPLARLEVSWRMK